MALQGHEVVFLERPELIPVLLESGLHLTIAGKTHVITNPGVIRSLSQLKEVAPFDVAVFALKSYDTPAAVAELKPLNKFLPPVLCLQNGVENEDVLRQVLGVDSVIPGTVTSAVGRLGLGNVQLEKLRGVGIGSGHPISRRLVDAFSNAGLEAKLFENPLNMKWSKMLTNLIANASSAILDMPPGEILNHPGIYKLEIRQLREALAVMKRQNIHTIDLPGTPVRLLAFAVSSLPLAVSRIFLARAAGSGRGGKMPSFHIDLHSGKGNSEVSYLNGMVARTGKRLQVATPVNAAYTTVLEALTKGNYPLDEFKRQPQKLIDLINSPS